MVKGIFRDYLNGENLSAIARKLNESGVASPGKIRYAGGFCGPGGDFSG